MDTNHCRQRRGTITDLDESSNGVFDMSGRCSEVHSRVSCIRYAHHVSISAVARQRAVAANARGDDSKQAVLLWTAWSFKQDRAAPVWCETWCMVHMQ